MQKEEYKFSISVYDSIDELDHADSFLLSQARSVTQFAYAPYSNFQVGAVAQLVNGETVSGKRGECIISCGNLCVKSFTFFSSFSVSGYSNGNYCNRL